MMKKPILLPLVLLCTVLLRAAEPPSQPAPAETPATKAESGGAIPEVPPAGDNPLMSRINWLKGPAKAELREFAEIQVPEGYMMTGAKGTREILEAMGNPSGQSELGFFAPTNLSWFVVFSFEDSGYVKDDDKDKLDADKILKTIRSGTEQSNEYRKERGIPPLNIVGWEYPPKYDETTHNLEWAIRAESEGEPILNYNVRILGRRGVMEANLVIEPAKLGATLPIFRDLLKGYSYKAGQTYAEYRDGDKLAQYGLAALITGGAAAVALKTGLFGTILLFFKKAYKLVVAAVVAVVVGIKRLVLGKPRQDLMAAQPPETKA